MKNLVTTEVIIAQRDAQGELHLNPFETSNLFDVTYPRLQKLSKTAFGTNFLPEFAEITTLEAQLIHLKVKWSWIDGEVAQADDVYGVVESYAITKFEPKLIL